MHSIQTAIAVALVAAISSAAAAQSSPDPKRKGRVARHHHASPVRRALRSRHNHGEKGHRTLCAFRALDPRKAGRIHPQIQSRIQHGYCLGWINSAKAFLQFHNAEGNHTLGVCMPEEITSRQVIDIFLTYAYKNTESLNYNPSLILYWSLLDRYPCPATAAQPAGAVEKK